MDKIKECDRWLTPEDIGMIVGKPSRFVIRTWLRTGLLKSTKVGGNGYRVLPRVWKEFEASGFTGFRHAAPSGPRK